MTNEQQALELFIKATVLARQRNECQERLDRLEEEIQDTLDLATDLCEGRIEEAIVAKQIKIAFGGSAQ